jgi:hypothetical protein
MVYGERHNATQPSGEDASGSKGGPGLSLLLGPFVGLAYVIALPFIAIATIASLIGKKLIRGIVDLMGHLVSFGWRPTEAHLAGKKKDKKREHKADDS